LNPIVPAAIAATALLAMAGCGGGSSDEDQSRSTFDQATAALKEGNGKQFCEALTPSAAKTIGDRARGLKGIEGCSQVVSNVIKATKELSTGDWKSFCEAIGPEAAARIAQGGNGSCAAAATALNNTPAGKQAFESIGQQLKGALVKVEEGKLGTVKVNGNTATGDVASEGQSANSVTFEKVDGKWRLSSNALGSSGDSGNSGASGGSGGSPQGTR